MGLLRNVGKKLYSFFPVWMKKYLKKVRFNDSVKVYKGMSWGDYYYQAIRDFRPEADEKEKEILRKDMRKAYLEDGTRPDEYLLYRYDRINQKEKDEYLPRYLKDLILIDYYKKKNINPQDILALLRDKFAFYESLKDFFKRDVIKISTKEDFLIYKDFCNKHHRFIAKEINGGCGVGVQIFSVEDEEHNRTVFNDLIAKGEWVIEDVIKQNQEISSFNSSSINTIRFPSFRHGTKVISAYPCMRFGRTGSIVDNAGQGGLFVSVDLQTGKITTDGYDEHGNVFECHPDSGVKFKGFQIPQWKELLLEARDAHLALPEEQTYVAFDFALSDKGWVIVEGNWGDFILQQVSMEKGFKTEFLKLLEE